MNNNQRELIQILDNALEIAKKMQLQETNNQEMLDSLLNKLTKIKNQVINDSLSASQKGVTLGLSRQVSDWVESLDAPLLKAVRKIDEYYQQKYCGN
ncbi:MAG: hypothetical protein QNJ64_04570 [Crocosphaera sp.]|nr:hypothetical protein [Crocosphaera sp.]